MATEIKYNKTDIETIADNMKICASTASDMSSYFDNIFANIEQRYHGKYTPNLDLLINQLAQYSMLFSECSANTEAFVRDALAKIEEKELEASTAFSETTGVKAGEK